MIDIPEGFNALMAVAYSIVPAAGQTAQAAIAAQFGSAFGELWSLHNNDLWHAWAGTVVGGQQIYHRSRC